MWNGGSGDRWPMPCAANDHWIPSSSPDARTSTLFLNPGPDMKRTAIQFLIPILLFAAIWYGLSRIDFVGETTTGSIGRETERRIGDLLLRQLDLKYQRVDNDSMLTVVDMIHRRICEANGLNPDSIAVHVFDSATINAAVLPGRNVIVFTGLLSFAENAEEFAGVLAHELGHITENHVMDRMMTEFGTTLLLMMSGMDAGSEVIANILRILTTTAFSRDQEREADQKAIDYLTTAEIDPMYLGNFLLRVSTKNGGRNIPEWVSTHPDSRERAAKIFERREEMDKEFAPLYAGDWDELVH